MKNNVFKVVLLQALPASGKSEELHGPCGAREVAGGIPYR